ncbi:MAG: serine/threonine protein kinase [Candidatus Brocadiae bacterium]|nr:serine/threonine protein kinase [Candidatus Brocadiia bacterium]
MIGKTFQDFTILRVLGKGGMGIVYLALQNSLDREVALKVIDTSSPLYESSSVSRFLREAKLAASLNHPNIVSIYSAGQEKDFLYIAMEYIKGSSLDERIRKGNLNETFIWEIAWQICQALQTALQGNIIHRDIKPGNILITQAGEAKLADFGLSKRTSDDMNLTCAGVILGTPNYMSPEQIFGEKIDFRSDIYSLGATIYHALTKNTLFSGNNVYDIVHKHKYEKVKPIQEYDPSLKEQSNQIIMKMLAKDPNDRYQSYTELMNDIQDFFFSHSNSPAMKGSDKINPIELKKPFLQSFLPFLPGQENKAESEFLLVSSMQTRRIQKDTDRPSFKTSVAKVLSMSELELHLKQKKESSVILDLDSLELQMADFALLLKEKFPQTPLLFLIESAEENYNENGLLSLPYERNEAKLAKFLENLPFSLQALQSKNFQFRNLVWFIEKFLWTMDISLESVDKEPGSIAFIEGKLEFCKYKNLRGNLALASLYQDEVLWKRNLSNSSALPFPTSRNLSTEIKKLKDSKIKEKNVEFEKTQKYEIEANLDSEQERTIRFPSDEHHNFLLKILVIEDRVINKDGLLYTINKMDNVMLLVARNTKEASEFMNVEDFSVVISDASLAGSLKKYWYEEIQKYYPQIYQIVLIDGHSQVEQNTTVKSKNAIFYSNFSDFSDLVEILESYRYCSLR